MDKLFCKETKENRVNEIINSLKIEEDILAIYPYGSRVYGTASETSDYDYIVVTKGAFLKSGAFKQNAISSDDRKIQAVLYSRTGFIDALNNYEMGAIECIFLDSSQVLLSKWPFRIQKWDTKEMVNKVIQKASASWHIASRQSKDGFKAIAKKGIFHSLRILMFGLQLKEYQTIYNYSEANELKSEMDSIPEDMFDDRAYLGLRDELMQKLKK
jgi:predicted nucleotidyltransferase